MWTLNNQQALDSLTKSILIYLQKCNKNHTMLEPGTGAIFLGFNETRWPNFPIKFIYEKNQYVPRTVLYKVVSVLWYVIHHLGAATPNAAVLIEVYRLRQVDAR